MKYPNTYLMRTMVLTPLVLFCFLKPLAVQTDSLSNLPQYLFPHFTMSVIKLKTGITAVADMNYNTLTGKMTFFQDGVLSELNKPETVDTVFIQNRQFVFNDNEFFEVLVNAPATFFIQHKSNISSAGRPGAYGTTSQTSGPTSVSKMYGESRTYNFKLPDEIKVVPSPFYWVRVNNEMHRFLTVKQFIRIFPTNEDEIKKYIKENNLTIDNYDELKKLGIYCNKVIRQGKKRRPSHNIIETAFLFEIFLMILKTSDFLRFLHGFP